MPTEREALKAALRDLVKAEPEFLDELLGQRFLRNPFPPGCAGHRLQVDPTARVSPQAHVELVGEESRIEIGPYCGINVFAWLRAWDQGIRMGAHCTLNHYAMIQGQVFLGDGVRIGAHSLFIGTEHNFDRRNLPIYRQGTTKRGITVGSDVYVGSNVTVLDGVTIGDGVVIAAGAVVNRDLPDYTVCGGIPARVIRERPA